MCLFSLVLLCLVETVLSHGRFIEPPARTSAWRFGFSTPRDYNDHETNCGGFSRQWSKNKGRCGQCGDAFDLAQPRAGEGGGKFGRGVIVRSYSPGQLVRVTVDVTANHKGYFQFSLCPHNNPKAPAPASCFSKHLEFSEGGDRFYIAPGTGSQSAMVRLPAGLTCSHCVLQWRYVAGNNWGLCPDGEGRVGCGPQEEFRACADIRIKGGATNNNNSNSNNIDWSGTNSWSNNNNNNKPVVRPVKPQPSWTWSWSWLTNLLRPKPDSSWPSGFGWKDGKSYSYFMSSLLKRPAVTSKGSVGSVLLASPYDNSPRGILDQYRQFCKNIAEAIITRIYTGFTSLFS